jgi:hypothetical protein
MNRRVSWIENRWLRRGLGIIAPLLVLAMEVLPCCARAECPNPPPVTISAQPPSDVVGLVGLHIVQKTSSRPQWIWSTFEQVDNVPGGSSHGPFNYNNGDGSAMPSSNPNPFPPHATPSVFNVQRFAGAPINPSTVHTNSLYQTALRAGGGPWEFYQLVMTQWPLQENPPQPIPPTQPGTPGNTFPGGGANSAFANVVLETFDQTRIQTGCMNCHTGAQQTTDLLWSLEVNAWPSPVPPPSTPMIALRAPALAVRQLPAPLAALRELMRSTGAP